MPGVAVGQNPTDRVENTVEYGDEQPAVGVCQDAAVGFRQRPLWVVRVLTSVSADKCAAGRHVQRSAYTFVGHIRDYDS